MQDPQEDPYNGKVLVAAIICLSVVVLFVVLLHAYGRWLLRHSLAASAANEVHEFQRRRRSTGQQAEEEAVFSARDDGLDAKVVAALPEFVYRMREQQGRPVDCVVCLSAMEEGERGKMLPSCGHRFHLSCIDEWLTAHSTCPICRAVAAAAEEVGSAVAAGQEVEVVVVEGEVVGAGVAGEVGAVVEMLVGAGNDDGCRIYVKEDAAASSSSTPSSCSSSLISCSLKRMLSRSRSDKRVFPSDLGS